jgi:hypothetical protein
VLCHDVTAPVDQLDAVRAELVAAGIEPPMLLTATKADDAEPEALYRLARACRARSSVGQSSRLIIGWSLVRVQAGPSGFAGTGAVLSASSRETSRRCIPYPGGRDPPSGGIAGGTRTLYLE